MRCEEVMQQEALCLALEETVQAAAARAKQVVGTLTDRELATAEQPTSRHHKSRVVCVDDNDRLVGVISLSDLGAQPATGTPVAASTTRKGGNECRTRWRMSRPRAWAR